MPPRRPAVVTQDQLFGATRREKSKRERTIEIGKKRAAFAVKAIRNCAQLGNPNVYDLFPGEAETFRQVLIDEVEAMFYALKNPGRTRGPIGLFEDDAAAE